MVFIQYVFFFVATLHVGPAKDNDAKSLYVITIIRMSYTMTCINGRPYGVNIYKY